MDNKDAGTSRSIIRKAYVNQEGRAVIVCPECKKAKAVNVDNLPKRRTSLNVQCSCETFFKVHLDYRQSYRKTTDLIGVCRLGMNSSNERLVKIKNLSLGGICLEIAGVHNLQKGQKGYIDFVLDDKRRTPISRVFSIESVHGNNVGCKFKQEQSNQKELGYYLRPDN